MPLRNLQFDVILDVAWVVSQILHIRCESVNLIQENHLNGTMWCLNSHICSTVCVYYMPLVYSILQWIGHCTFSTHCFCCCWTINLKFLNTNPVMQRNSLHSSWSLLRRFYARDDASKTLWQLCCRRKVVRHSMLREGEICRKSKLDRFSWTHV